MQEGVLITDGNIVTVAERSSVCGDIWWDGHYFSGYEWEWDFDTRDITHWAKLPLPPHMISKGLP